MVLKNAILASNTTLTETLADPWHWLMLRVKSKESNKHSNVTIAYSEVI